MAFTLEQKEEYRRHKERVGYDKRSRAVGIIQEAFRVAHPNALPNTRPRDGIVTCGSPIVHDDVKIRIDANGHEYHDHKRCNSWACPVCAPKRARERAAEIEQALIGANELGFSCYFITFTVPHRRCHSTAYVLEVLNGCYKKVLQDKGIRALKCGNGYVGQIKCKDYTLTENGTHAHLHCLWLFEGVEDAAAFAAELRSALFDKWDRLVYLETGRHVHGKYGFDLELCELGKPGSPDAERVAHYAAKSISVYMSENDKGKSKTPFDLLSSNATDEDAARYLDWYKGQKGKRHIFFSHGLKKLLKVGDVKQVPADNAIIAWVGYDNAYLLKDVEVKHEFETRAAASVSGALEWLQGMAAARRERIRRRYGGSNFCSDVWTVPYSELVRELDDCPVDGWREVLCRYRHEQEVEFPADVEYWNCYTSVHGNQLLREFEAEHTGFGERTDEMIREYIEGKMAERWAVNARLEFTKAAMRGLGLVGRKLPPLYTPRSYARLETYEERADWIAEHRHEYRERANARLLANMSLREAERQERVSRRAVERGEVFEDSLFDGAGVVERPRRVSGLGAAFAAAGVGLDDGSPAPSLGGCDFVSRAVVRGVVVDDDDFGF